LTQTKDKVIPSLAPKWQHHMEKEFTGNWFVTVSEGNVSSSWKKN